MTVRVVPYALPLLAPVRGRVTRRGWVVAVEEDGLVGWGEAACWPGFGAGARATRRALRPRASEGRSTEDTEDAPRAPRPLGASPEARGALEQAHLDLAAQRAGVSLAAWLAPAPRASVAVHALVAGPDDVERWPGVTTFKLKVGDAPWPRDLARVRAVRAAAPAARLRLDVNGRWSVADAIPRLRALADLGVDLVEQPTPPGDLAGLARARSEGGVRVALDEGLRGEDDLDAALATRAIDAVVLKSQALGGLLAAGRLARRAAAAGLEVVVTHALETAVGRAGALALAAGLPGDPVCGLGPALAVDVADLPAVAGGRAPLPAGVGLGVTGAALDARRGVVTGGGAWS
ncbi:MAG: mandelate racemase/muconate lactonizing enzyme family protein [Planctomycetes bacterium]|nr:mandelate racemase/muconate lactonizing enzyme family protein [Planctomycetota bacterium]